MEGGCKGSMGLVDTLKIRPLEPQEAIAGFLSRGDVIRFVFWKDHFGCPQEVGIDLQPKQIVGALLEVIIVQVGHGTAWLGRVTVEVEN